MTPETPLPEPWTSAGRWFDPAWYVRRNKDVAQAGIDPLAHYLHYGESEGRSPCPWFDPIWYRLAHDIPADQSPLAHFLGHRTVGQFAPCARLYPVPYTDPWRGTPDPFDRFLELMAVPEREVLPDLTILQSSGLIDVSYFRINHVNVIEAELNPALHYCRFGHAAGLRPNDMFDPIWYRETNPDMAHKRINPLLHYILEGEAANHPPVIWFDPIWYRTQYQVPPDHLALAHYLAHRHDRTVSPHALFDPAWYAGQNGLTIPPDIDPFSHFLVTGAVTDVNPSPHFNARLWRHQHMTPLDAPGQDQLPFQERNPLVHFLRRNGPSS